MPFDPSRHARITTGIHHTGAEREAYLKVSVDYETWRISVGWPFIRPVLLRETRESCTDLICARGRNNKTKNNSRPISSATARRTPREERNLIETFLKFFLPKNSLVFPDFCQMQAAHESYADNPSSSTSHKNKKKQHTDMKGAQFTIQSNIKSEQCF